MKASGWATLGLSAAMVIASGLAFFLYVPVLVIGAVWLFILAVLLSLGLGVRIGWSLRTHSRTKAAKRGKNYLPTSESEARLKVVPIDVSVSVVPLQELTKKAAVN